MAAPLSLLKRTAGGVDRDQRRTPILVVALTAVALLAASCGVIGGEDIATDPSSEDVSQPEGDSSATDPSNTTTSTTAATADGLGGIVYVSTAVGDLEFHNPAANSRGVLLSASAETSPVTQVIPAEQAQRLLLMQNTGGDLTTKLSEVSNGQIAPITSQQLDTGFVICFDNHAGADIVVGHTPIGAATQYEIDLGTVPFLLSDPTNTDIAVGTFESPTISCPVWSGDRTTSAVAQLSEDGADPTTGIPVNVEVHVRGPLMDRVISWPGCNTAPIGFNPDDSVLALRVLCEGDQAATAGIYLIDVQSNSEPRKVAEGWFNAGVWSPNGQWIAGAFTRAPREAISANETYDLVLVNVDSSETIAADLSPGASIATIAWVQGSVHS